MPGIFIHIRSSIRAVARSFRSSDEFFLRERPLLARLQEPRLPPAKTISSINQSPKPRNSTQSPHELLLVAFGIDRRSVRLAAARALLQVNPRNGRLPTLAEAQQRQDTSKALSPPASESCPLCNTNKDNRKHYCATKMEILFDVTFRQQSRLSLSVGLGPR